MNIRVAIVEDESEFVDYLKQTIDRQPGMECVGAFDTGSKALRKIPKLNADIVLMDIGLPDKDGIECVRRLKDTNPALQCMMMTVVQDEDKIFKSLKAGATGYLLKIDAPEKLAASIQDLYDGGSPMSPTIARMVLTSFHAEEKSKAELKQLTAREHQILEELSQGYLYKEIAGKLNISLHTVRMHIHNIYEKLQVKCKVEAINILNANDKK